MNFEEELEGYIKALKESQTTVFMSAEAKLNKLVKIT